jgi:hypothetical protein
MKKYLTPSIDLTQICICDVLSASVEFNGAKDNVEHDIFF